MINWGWLEKKGLDNTDKTIIYLYDDDLFPVCLNSIASQDVSGPKSLTGDTEPVTFMQ